ncbi:putative proline-rich receptor-like protein kinase PERK2 [Iris pallida]|uniref:Proline-rich receptor-like protein kinase PERK2 n=1 Tax=Iris pallida TaxID=29817 RepID=A0AAX6GCY9_IRIPA|nr:putative proline-rich receptor-like protein kinase PERK2 [Iris pallida]
MTTTHLHLFFLRLPGPHWTDHHHHHPPSTTPPPSNPVSNTRHHHRKLPHQSTEKEREPTCFCLPSPLCR